MKNERPTVTELARILSHWSHGYRLTKRVGGRGAAGIRYDIFQTANRERLAIVTIRLGPRSRPRIASVCRVQDARKTIDFGSDGRPLRNLEPVQVWGHLGPIVNETEDS